MGRTKTCVYSPGGDSVRVCPCIGPARVPVCIQEVFPMRMIPVITLLVPLSVFAAEPAGQVYDGWPFDAAEAAKRQASTAKQTGAADPLTVVLSDKPERAIKFRLIPAGKFMMGSPADEPGHEPDEPLHPETVAEPFYIMETQLSVEHYRA